MELWTAIVLGFMGSFHCVGMCGPIAMAIPRSSSSFITLSFNAIVYNSGRILTYSLFGLLFGLIGKQITISGFQGWLSIALGAGILVGVFFNKFAKKPAIQLFAPFTSGITKAYGILIRKESKSGLFGLGFLNGLLPCAFVYSGLAAAVLTVDVAHSMAYMALFGLGTFPAMYFMYLSPRILSKDVRGMIKDWIPYFAFTLGLLLVVRGLVLQDLIVDPALTERVDAFCVFPGTSMD